MSISGFGGAIRLGLPFIHHFIELKILLTKLLRQIFVKYIPIAMINTNVGNKERST